MPYYEDNGDVWDTERVFYKEEDFNRVAQEVMSEYEKMKDLKITSKGIILDKDDHDDEEGPFIIYYYYGDLYDDDNMDYE